MSIHAGRAWLAVACVAAFAACSAPVPPGPERFPPVVAELAEAKASWFVPEQLPGAPTDFGCAGIADLDRDGALELYAAGSTRLRSFRKTGSEWVSADTVLDRTASSEGYVGCDVADFDADGDDDLVVTGGSDGWLLVNEGSRGLKPSRLPAWGPDPSAQSFGAAAVPGADPTLPDLYLLRSGKGLSAAFVADGCICSAEGVFRCGKMDRQYPGSSNVLLRNRGGGVFERDTTDPLNVLGTGLAMGVFDLDRDGRQDVFIANDAGFNRVFRGAAGGAWSELPESFGHRLYNHAMSVVVGDLDGDQWQDLAVSEVGVPLVQLGGPSGLSAPLGPVNGLLPIAAWSWGAAMEDFDNDGDLDMLFYGFELSATEFATVCTRYNRPLAAIELLLYRNDGHAHFTVERPFRADADPWASDGWAGGHELAVDDVDGDGVLDVFVLRAQGFDGVLRVPWVLRGAVADGARGVAIEAPQGSWVKVCAAGRCQEREVSGQHGASAFFRRKLHFGLGLEPSATVTVRAPEGAALCDATVPAGGHFRCPPAP